MDKHQIYSSYIDYLLENGHAPATVYKFCKELGCGEKEFFEHFASFEALESDFWESEVREVVSAIEQGGEWQEFDVRQRMLTFLYALIGRATERRSLVILRFTGLSPIARPVWLRGWWCVVKEFAKSLVDTGVTAGSIADRGRMLSAYPEMLTMLTRSVMEFFARDTSKGFEKTDAYIEKGCNLAFDLMQSQALDSAFDLAKFLLPMHIADSQRHESSAAKEH